MLAIHVRVDLLHVDQGGAQSRERILDLVIQPAQKLRRPVLRHGCFIHLQLRLLLAADGAVVINQQQASDEKPQEQSNDAQVADGHAKYEGNDPEIGCE